MTTAARLDHLRRQLAEKGLDAALILSDKNRRYLSGFHSSDGTVLVGPAAAYLVVDFRYAELAQAQVSDMQVIQAGGSAGNKPLLPTVRELLAGMGTRRVGFEGNHLAFDQHAELAAQLTDFELVSLGSGVDGLRAVKDSAELDLIRRACAITDAAFQHILRYMRPGMREADVALELEWVMRKQGAAGAAFEFIVASGVRSASPHGMASNKLLATGDLVTLDFGCCYQGYMSDMTRTVVLGEPDDRQRRIYEAVLAAQRLGLAAVRSGAACKAVDSACRDYLADQGFAENFGHSTGHGVGLDIHEEPSLSQRSTAHLQPGNVVTIEPGVYIPGWGGVRIEDSVIVTETGCEVLTLSPKELIILE